MPRGKLDPVGRMSLEPGVQFRRYSRIQERGDSGLE